MQVSKTYGKTTITADGSTQLEVFTNIASMEEVFCESKCGKCNSEEINFRVRNVTEGKKEYVYPEMVCKKCYAKLTFGQSEGGKLFPVRFEREDGEYKKGPDGKNIQKGSHGWVKYNKETGKEE